MSFNSIFGNKLNQKKEGEYVLVIYVVILVLIVQILLQYVVGFIIDLILGQENYVINNLLITISSIIILSTLLFYYIIPYFRPPYEPLIAEGSNWLNIFMFGAYTIICLVSSLLIRIINVDSLQMQSFNSNWRIFSQINSIGVVEKGLINILILIVFPIFAELIFHRYLLEHFEFRGMTSLQAVLVSSLFFAFTYSVGAAHLYELFIPVGFGLYYLVLGGSGVIIKELINLPEIFFNSFFVIWAIEFWFYLLLGLITGAIYVISRKIEFSILAHSFGNIVMYLSFLGIMQVLTIWNLISATIILLLGLSTYYFIQRPNFTAIQESFLHADSRTISNRKGVIKLFVVYLLFIFVIRITRANISFIPVFIIGPLTFIVIAIGLSYEFYKSGKKKDEENEIKNNGDDTDG